MPMLKRVKKPVVQPVAKETASDCGKLAPLLELTVQLGLKVYMHTQHGKWWVTLSRNDYKGGAYYGVSPDLVRAYETALEAFNSGKPGVPHVVS